MAKWGLKWANNSFWGVLSGPYFETFCEVSDTRVLVQMDDTPGNRDFRDFLCQLAEGYGHYVDVADDIIAGFDISTAVGTQLDMIGATIDLPRSGFDDATYRVLLQMQSNLLLGTVEGDWTGSVNNVLTLTRTFIGPTVNPIVYFLKEPYSFTMTIPKLLTVNEIIILFRFIKRGLYAAVLGYIEFIPIGDNLWGSHYGGVGSPGVWDSHYGGVATPALWGTVILP